MPAAQPISKESGQTLYPSPFSNEKLNGDAENQKETATFVTETGVKGTMKKYSNNF